MVLTDIVKYNKKNVLSRRLPNAVCHPNVQIVTVTFVFAKYRGQPYLVTHNFIELLHNESEEEAADVQDQGAFGNAGLKNNKEKNFKRQLTLAYRGHKWPILRSTYSAREQLLTEGERGHIF